MLLLLDASGDRCTSAQKHRIVFIVDDKALTGTGRRRRVLNTNKPAGDVTRRRALDTVE
jgi:hypothetical protein